MRATPKPKPAPKPLKWEPVDLLKGRRPATIAEAMRVIVAATDRINTMGRELTRLKNEKRRAK